MDPRELQQVALEIDALESTQDKLVALQELERKLNFGNFLELCRMVSLLKHS